MPDSIIKNSVAAKPRKENQILAIFKRLSRNKGAMCGLYIFAIIVIMSLFAPWLEPYNHEIIDYSQAFQSPSFAHLFGTDHMGRDLFSMMLYGSRFSLRIGIFATLISVVGGIIIGGISGFFGGTVDQVIMRLCDIVQSIPGLVLNIALACVLGEGFGNCILALGISGIVNFARLVRASILKIRKMEYLDAATSINCSDLQIIVSHILPNIISPIIVQASLSVATNIMTAASLSYLGLGVQPPNPEWGAILSAGRTYIRKFPYMTTIPGIVIMVTVLALNLLGDGLRDALDPKLKK